MFTERRGERVPLIRAVLGVGAGRHCTRGNTLFCDAMILCKYGDLIGGGGGGRISLVYTHRARRLPTQRRPRGINAVGGRASVSLQLSIFPASLPCTGVRNARRHGYGELI